jgi:hypothetical protein
MKNLKRMTSFLFNKSVNTPYHYEGIRDLIENVSTYIFYQICYFYRVKNRQCLIKGTILYG